MLLPWDHEVRRGGVVGSTWCARHIFVRIASHFWHLRQGSNAHLANMCAEADVSRAESQQQSDSGWCARVELWGVSRIRWEGMTEKMWEEEQRREVSGLIDPSSREISRSVPQVQRGRERGTDWGGTTTRAWTLARLESSGARGWP